MNPQRLSKHAHLLEQGQPSHGNVISFLDARIERLADEAEFYAALLADCQKELRDTENIRSRIIAAANGDNRCKPEVTR
jgi:hypothetical protein